MLFQTKKRSFDLLSWESRTVWISILGVATAVSASLAGSVVLLMAPRDVKFLHLRAANVSEQRFSAFSKERMVSRESPMFFLGESLAIFGRTKDVVAPLEKSSIGVVGRINWQSELAAKIQASQSLREVFPVRELVIVFGENSKDVGDIMVTKEVLENFQMLNVKISGNKIVPTVIIGSAADKLDVP
jgi:hypothetical protein